MTRTELPDEKTIEVWRISHEGTVWVWTYDRREDKYIKTRVGGRQGGSKTLHISTADRRWNQERVVEENKHLDPFVNGSLIHTSVDVVDDIDTTYHLTSEDLEAIFETKDFELFKEEIEGIKSELVLRRLQQVGHTRATVGQLEFLNSVVDERYRVGGTQKTVREMIKAGEEIGGTQLS